MLVCAVDWIGMADEDVGNAITVLQDLSQLPDASPTGSSRASSTSCSSGRTMIHRAGFASNPAFQLNGRSLIDTRRLFYYGNSQGGIAGGALTAVAPDFNRSVLYVGAMNYSLLLNRSVDFDLYALILNPYYPNPLERQLVLSMIQVLWDRGEPNGYAWHMTSDPPPNTPRHKVLQLLSFGDHQVANLATEVQARTLGSHLRCPAVDPGRHADREPYYGIPRIRRFPYEGDASLVVWDIGPLRPPGCGAAGRARVPRHAHAADRQRAAARGRGPARPGDPVRGAGPPPDLRVPPHRRQGDRRVRQRALPRGRAGPGPERQAFRRCRT